jgi:hypothetical protein
LLESAYVLESYREYSRNDVCSLSWIAGVSFHLALK